jgi:hypothetical protein
MVKNHYKSERIQKTLPKLQDEQLAFTGMKINKHFLLVGGTGAGKTNALYDYIVQTSQPKKGTFRHIYICYKTDETLYDDMKTELKDGISFFKSVAEFPSVDVFPDASANDYKDKYLVIFDDCINDKDKGSYDKIRKYFTYGRKKGVTIAYLAQSFYDADSFIRKQMSYLLLLSIKGKRDLDNILRDFGGIDIETSVLYKIFKTATTPDGENEMPFLKIHVRNVKIANDLVVIFWNIFPIKMTAIMKNNYFIFLQ